MPPRVRSVPPRIESAGEEAIDLASAAGLELDDWQRDVVKDFLSVREDGKWFKNAALLCPRQNGKGAILEAIELADLFLFGTRLVIHTAHEFATANEAFLRLKAHIDRNDWMSDQVERITTANGNVGIHLVSGQRLLFKARSQGSQRGFSCDRMIYDEAYNLPEATLEASLPSMSARPNAQTILTSSAPTARPESDVLRKFVRAGRRAPNREGVVPDVDPNLVYVEFSADPKADLDDRDAWIQANPGHLSARGVPTLETMADERSRMSEVGFARERMGILDDSSGSTVIDMEVWHELGDADSSPLDPVSFAVDVAPDQSFSTIAIAGDRADGLMHLEVVERKRGTGWVADRLAELQSRWEPASIVIDPIGQAAALIPALDEAGVNYDLFSTKDVTSACAFWFSLVQERRLRHVPQDGLRAALEAARQRKVRESGWAWHRRDATDITPLVAVTNAAYAHALKQGRAVDAVDSRMVFFSR